MKKVLIDSGVLIALFDAANRHHNNVIKFIKNNKLPLITTIASITETLHLLDFNRDAQVDFLDWIHKGALEVHNIEHSDFNKIKELTKQYHNLVFADSCLVFLAKKLNINTIATIDENFDKINEKFTVILL